METESLSAMSTGYCPGCEECEESAIEYSGERFIEPWFTWSSCECCGSTLGGNREPIHGVDADNEIVHLDGCEDCILNINGYTVEREGGQDASQQS